MRKLRLGLGLPISLVAALACTVAGGSLSCSESTPAPLASPNTDAGTTADSGRAVPSPFATPSIPCTDTADSVYGDYGTLTADDGARGNILKCTSSDPALSVADIQAKLDSLGYAGKPVTSGAKVYRISYRTERGDTNKTPVAASALVYAPDAPRTGTAGAAAGAKLPIIVASHGSRGQAAKCAVSKLDPSLDDINGDAWRMAYPLVGHGFAVILPDLAGYANQGAPGNPENAYASADDAGRSTLDGARALQKLFTFLDNKLVLVGHSQGGHTALSALALADTYGTPAPIVGTAVYAPLWLSQRSWGAILYAPATVNFKLAESSAGNVSVWYHYTHAELLDGVGEGKKLFAADKQAAVEDFAKNECWDSTALQKLGTYATDLFDHDFINSVSLSAATGSSCTAGDAVCTKWTGRYVADRPHLTGTGASTPILLAYGLKDTTLTPDRMRCVLDRLHTDNTKLTACVDSAPDHSGIVSARGDYVADWIANVALGEAAPAACTQTDTVLTTPCATPPPND